MEEPNVKTLIEDYLKAFEARDLPQCMEYFHSDATLSWQVATFQGKSSIEEWHRDRFDADLKILEIEGITVEGGTATVDLVVTSKRLKAWRFGSLRGRVTSLVQDGKIKETRFEMKSINPLENWS